MQKKNLVIALIKDDLINSKLVHSLNQIGLEADSYNLHASVTIMNLMKINPNPILWEKIHDEYLDHVKKVLQIDIQESPRFLDTLALEIYDLLKNRRNEIRLQR